MAVDFPDWSNAVTPGKFTLAGQRAVLVAVTGTRVALIGVATPAKMVMVEARAANLNVIYLGGVTVTNDETATGGLQLQPGAIVAFPTNDLGTVYLNGTAGDGLTLMYWT